MCESLFLQESSVSLTAVIFQPLIHMTDNVNVWSYAQDFTLKSRNALDVSLLWGSAHVVMVGGSKFFLL